jgi:transposase
LAGPTSLAQLVVEQGWTLAAAAEAAGVSVRCARKWVGRYRLEGKIGLLDRPSAPRRVANRAAPERVEAIVKLRRLRFTAAEIARDAGDGALDGFADPDPDRDGSPRTAGA